MIFVALCTERRIQIRAILFLPGQRPFDGVQMPTFADFVRARHLESEPDDMRCVGGR